MRLLLLRFISSGYTRRYFSVVFSYNKRIIIQLLHFGKYVFGTALFSNLSRYTDHFITSAISNPVLGTVYVSYYNAVSRLTNMIDVPSLAAADVLFPKNAQASGTEGNEKVKYYFERMCGTLFALVIPDQSFCIHIPTFYYIYYCRQILFCSCTNSSGNYSCKYSYVQYLISLVPPWTPLANHRLIFWSTL